MGILLNGNKPSKIIYNGAESSLYFNGSKIWPESSPILPDEVQIGNQIWKSKNLDINDGQGGVYTQTVNYGQGNVTEYYYTWQAATRIANSISGYHLPTIAEFNTLYSNVGSNGNKLRSTYGWTTANGTDDFGFNAVPAGGYQSGSYIQLYKYAFMWTADSKSTDDAYYVYLYNSTSFPNGFNRKYVGFSVRLIKDS